MYEYKLISYKSPKGDRFAVCFSLSHTYKFQLFCYGIFVAPECTEGLFRIQSNPCEATPYDNEKTAKVDAEMLNMSTTVGVTCGVEVLMVKEFN